MISREKTITEGATLSEPLGFDAASVLISNPTEQYLHLIDTNIYVLPGQTQAIWNLPAGGAADMAQAEWASPPGTAQPAGVANQQAVLTYYDVWLAPSSGVVVNVTASVSGSVGISNQPTIAGINSTVNTFSPQAIILPNPITVTPGGTASGTVNLSPGTQAVGIIIDPGGNPAHVLLQGAVSTVRYLELYFFSQSVYVVPWVTAVDSTLSYVLQSSGSGSTNFRLVALVESVPEFLQFYAPPQLSPNQQPLGFSKTIAGAGAPVSLITEATNVGLWLFDSTVSANAAFELWQGTATTPKGTLIGSYASPNISTVPLTYQGAPITRGDGVYLNNPSGATTLTLTGHLSYSKG